MAASDTGFGDILDMQWTRPRKPGERAAVESFLILRRAGRSTLLKLGLYQDKPGKKEIRYNEIDIELNGTGDKYCDSTLTYESMHGMIIPNQHRIHQSVSKDHIIEIILIAHQSPSDNQPDNELDLIYIEVKISRDSGCTRSFSEFEKCNFNNKSPIKIYKTKLSNESTGVPLSARLVNKLPNLFECEDRQIGIAFSNRFLTVCITDVKQFIQEANIGGRDSCGIYKVSTALKLSNQISYETVLRDAIGTRDLEVLDVALYSQHHANQILLVVKGTEAVINTMIFDISDTGLVTYKSSIQNQIDNTVSDRNVTVSMSFTPMSNIPYLRFVEWNNICYMSVIKRQNLICPAMPTAACACLTAGLDNSIECTPSNAACTVTDGKNYFAKNFQHDCTNEDRLNYCTIKIGQQARCKIHDNTGFYIQGLRNTITFEGSKIVKDWMLTGEQDVMLSSNVTEIVSDIKMTSRHCGEEESFKRVIVNRYHSNVKTSSLVKIKFVCEPKARCTQSVFKRSHVISRSDVNLNCPGLKEFLSDAIKGSGVVIVRYFLRA